jgi:predicted transcriptional regulator
MEYSRKEVLTKVLFSLKQQGKQSIAELVFSTRLPYGVIQEAIKTLEEKGLVRVEKMRANPHLEEEPVDSLDIIELNE